MATKGFWAGWVGFAALMMVIMGVLDVIQGLIAIIRDEYYVLAAEQVILFDLSTWGWIIVIWGIVLALAGYALASGAEWARWFTILVGSVNFIVQLGFVGSSQYTLWALAVLGMTLLVLYALIVRWGEIKGGPL